jgi:hypothetical protein
MRKQTSFIILLMPFVLVASDALAQKAEQVAHSARPHSQSHEASSRNLSSVPPVDSSEMTTSSQRMASDVATLVEFRNRNSCGNGEDSGIYRAAEWLRHRYSTVPKLSVRVDEFSVEDCGVFKSGIHQRNVLGVLEGTDPALANEIILIGAHYDSRTLQVHDSSSEAPGANDSGSQTAVLLEAAEKLAKANYRRTIVFASFAGEEQGLDGSAHLASHIVDIFPGKKVIAMLNFDIVGGDSAVNDEDSLHRIRLYAPDVEPHRSLAHRIQALTGSLDPEMKIILKSAVDRPGRNGDQISFQNQNIPAVRFIEAFENPAHQHTPEDLPRNITPIYMARIAKLAEILVAAIAEPLK